MRTHVLSCREVLHSPLSSLSLEMMMRVSTAASRADTAMAACSTTPTHHSSSPLTNRLERS